MFLLGIKWLLICLPIVCLLLIGLQQFFYFGAFIGWNVKHVILLQSGLILTLFAFGFWVGDIFLETNKLGFVFLFAVLYSAVTISLATLFAAIANKYKSNFSAYYYNIATIDMIVLTTLIIATIKICKGMTDTALILSNCITLPLLLVGVSVVINFCMPAVFNGPQQEFEDFCDALPDGKGQKVKVILLTGQSNASGVSRLPYLKKKLPEKYPIYEKGFDNVWINYFNDNGATCSKGFVKAKAGQGCQKIFFGPELGLAEKLSDAHFDKPVFIVKYAWGGSNMYTQWLSDTSAKEEKRRVGKLYTAFINFSKKSLDHLTQKGYQPEVVANCWMQGESDALPNHINKYKVRTKNFVKDTKEALMEYLNNESFLFVDAGISDSVLANGKYIWQEYVQMNRIKKEISTEICGVFLDTVQAGLECKNEPTGEFNDPHTIDYAHYDALSGLKLGHMFGDAVVDYITKEVK